MLGANGRGAAEEQGVEDDVDFVVGTFSKSLGAIGGFGASDHPKFDLLRLLRRPYMFTASPCPASIASVRAAFGGSRDEPELRERLWANARLYAGLTAARLRPLLGQSPVIAVRLPDEQTAVWAWNRLLEHGVYVNLALPPGTPNGVCLLRCSVSAAHTSDQIDEVCRRFARVAAELDERRAGGGALAAQVEQRSAEAAGAIDRQNSAPDASIGWRRCQGVSSTSRRSGA